MKKAIFLIISLSLLISFGLGVIAQDDIKLPKPGIKPDSFFYFLDTFSERIGLFFTFGTENKVEKALKYAGEKLAEAKVMVEKNNSKALKKAIKEYLYYLKIANQKLAKAKEKGKLVDLISEKNLNYQKVLLAELDKVTKETKDEIKEAIEKTQESLEDTIKEASEEKTEELEQKIEELENELEEKLKEIEEELEKVAPSAPSLNDPGNSVSSGTSFSVSWSKPAGATDYVLQRDTDSSFSNPTEVYSGAENNATETLSPDDTTTYYYRANASNSAGSSDWSNVVDIKVVVGAPPSTDPPSMPTLDDPGDNFDAGTSFGISWSAVAGATSYRLERDDNSSFSSPTKAYSGSLNYYSETRSPATTKTYYYRVKASNSAGSSSWSNVVDVTINCLLPTAPVLIDPGDSTASGDAFNLNWSDVSGADGYTLEIDTDSSFSSPSVSQAATSNKSITPAAATTYYYG